MQELTKAVRDLRAAWLDYLFTRLADKLAGRCCLVEWIDPDLPGARGLALRAGEKGVIQVRPDLEPAQQLATFLHECAHIKLHFQGLAQRAELGNVLEVREQTTGRQIAPGWLMDRRKAAADLREREAQEQAAKWLDYAERRAPGGGLGGKLLALLDWKEG